MRLVLWRRPLDLDVCAQSVATAIGMDRYSRCFGKESCWYTRNWTTSGVTYGAGYWLLLGVLSCGKRTKRSRDCVSRSGNTQRRLLCRYAIVAVAWAKPSGFGSGSNGRSEESSTQEISFITAWGACEPKDSKNHPPPPHQSLQLKWIVMPILINLLLFLLLFF